VKARFKRNGETTWQILTLQESTDGQFQGTFRDGLPEGHYDLMIAASDNGGNSIEYIASPGFLIGESSSVPSEFITLVSPAEQGYTGRQPTFSWLPVTGAEYHLEVSKTEDFSTNIIDTHLTSTSYKTTTLLELYQPHYWRVSATAPGKFIQPSGKRTFYPQIPDPVQAIFPTNNSSGNATSIIFQWTTPEFAQNYTIEISTSPTFNSIIATTLTSTNEFPVVDLQNNTIYYWRILTHFDQNGWPYQAMSDVFVFNTGKVTETEKPVDILSGLSTYPNPFDHQINISFHLKKPGVVGFQIADPIGREVFIENFPASAGDNTIEWKGNDAQGTPLKNGVYLGRIQTGNEVHHVKMVLRR
jgi:hypothetical protein